MLPMAIRTKRAKAAKPAPKEAPEADQAAEVEVEVEEPTPAPDSIVPVIEDEEQTWL